MECLKGAVVIVTGASTGIGRGIAVHFSKLGSILTLTGRDQTKLDDTVAKCVESGSSSDQVHTVVGDLTLESTRKQLIDETVKKFGRLDVLVNNAGLSYTGSTLNTTDANYDLIMEINLKAPFSLTKLAAPHLIESKGRVVNVSSLCSTNAMPELGVYSMSKAALDMFTQCVALELAPKGVRVNSVNPGTVVSDIHRRETSNSPFKADKEYEQFLLQQMKRHPLGRVGYPEDVAQSVAYLASNLSSFVTGQIIYIDGGRHCVSTTTAKAS